MKMANEQNLIPNSERTPKQRRENAKKAGIASGEARRKKRDLKLAMQALLEADIKDKKTGETMSGAEALAVAQFRKAMKGDTKAFEVIRDTSGQSVVQKVAVAEVNQDIIDDIEKMVMDDELKE
jgi:hypothetical protein